MSEPEPSLPFTSRLWFAWACLLRVLFDGAFAARVFQVREAPALPEAKPPEPPPPAAKLEPPPAAKLEPPPAAKIEPPPPAKPEPPSLDPALQLLALLQREGRLVDFLEQDIASFPDADIGAAARVVHEGCRKALRGHAKIAPIRAEEEGASVTLEAGYRPVEVKLSGDVQGSAPYKGVLRHRGWRATDLALPTPVKGHDPSVIAPAEVEL